MPTRTGASAIIPITLPTPFPVGPVHCYLLMAEPITLIDCGVGSPAGRAALVQALAAHGLAPGDIRRVLLTHGHADHLGLAAWLQEQGAEVWLHPLDLGKALHQDWYLRGQQALMAAAGVPAAMVEQVAQLLGQARRLAPALAPDCRLLADGGAVPFAGFDLIPLHTPGHCIGHVAFWWEQEGILFSGDLLLAGISPNPLAEPLAGGGRALPLAQFLASLERVAALCQERPEGAAPPVRRAYPGHGPVVAEPGALVAQYRDLHARRLEQVAGALPPGGTTAFALARQFYPHVQAWDIYLALSEVLAHLDLLVARGRARVTAGEGGVERYELT